MAGPKIGMPLTGAALKQFINKLTFSIKPLISPKGKNEVLDEVIRKMVKLSGLNSDNPQMMGEFKASLNVQLGFINSLYDDSVALGEGKNTNDRLFRLIKSDHDDKKPLTLKDIQEQIKTLDNQVDPVKGEVGFKKNGFFIVNN